MDSLGKLELFMECEREFDFDLDIPDSMADTFFSGTAGDLWRRVTHLRTGEMPASSPPVADPIWIVVRRAVARVLEIPVDSVGPDTKLDA